MTFDSATPSQGTLLAGERHRHVPAGHGRQRRRRDDHDQGTAAVHRHDQQHGHRLVERQRPGLEQQHAPAPRPPSTRPRTWPSRTPTPPIRSRSGQQLTYTVGVSNAGPSSATGITLTDTLPAGVTFNSATPSQGTLLAGERHRHLLARARWRTPASASVSIKVTPQSAGTITNQANVTSLTGDPNTANNGASRPDHGDAAGEPVADEDGHARPGAGRPAAHLHLTVSNAGPAARHRTYRDRHPAGRRDLRLGDAFAGHLLAGERAPSRARSARSPTAANATVSIKVRPQAQGTITNPASVASDAIDTDAWPTTRRARRRRSTRSPTCR